MEPFEPAARLSACTTAAASTLVPSWNTAFGLSLNVNTVASALVVNVARSGTSFRFASYLTRLLKTRVLMAYS